MNQILSFILLALSLPVSAVPSERGGEQTILWQDAKHSQALFIPEPLLRSSELSELPISELSLLTLNTLVDLRRNPPSYYPGNPRFGPDDGCRTSHEPLPEEPVDGAKALLETLRETPVVFTGHVLDIHIGWDAWGNAVGSIAWIQIDHVLRDTGSDLMDQLRIAILLESGGQLTIGDTEICTVKVDTGLHSPSVGDHVLIAGAAGVFADPRFIATYLRFPIRDGKLQPQPYPNVKERDAVDLDSVVAGLSSNIDHPQGDR